MPLRIIKVPCNFHFPRRQVIFRSLPNVPPSLGTREEHSSSNESLKPPLDSTVHITLNIINIPEGVVKMAQQPGHIFCISLGPRSNSPTPSAKGIGMAYKNPSLPV